MFLKFAFENLFPCLIEEVISYWRIRLAYIRPLLLQVAITLFSSVLAVITLIIWLKKHVTNFITDQSFYYNYSESCLMLLLRLILSAA